MIRYVKIGLATLLALGALAACSSEPRESSSLSQLLVGAAQQSLQRRAGPPPPVVVTPKMLAETSIAALQVNPERTGGSDFLKRAATRRDSYPGRVEFWNSSDNAQIILRNGVVVGTKGVGGDIIAADAAMTVEALQNRRSNAGIRRYILSDGDVTTTEIQLVCEIDVVGAERIIIVNQSFRTYHHREKCVGDVLDGAPIVNDYWVDPVSGLLRKSRQWMGPRSGYFELILLKN